MIQKVVYMIHKFSLKCPPSEVSKCEVLKKVFSAILDPQSWC